MSFTMLVVMVGLCYMTFRIGQATAYRPDGVVGVGKSLWKWFGS